MSAAKIYNWLAHHYGLNLTTFDLCTVAKMSWSELSRQFTHAYAIDVWRYLSNIRLCNAKYLLENTPFSIEEVAYKVGWNRARLHAEFMNAYSMTPAEFRLKIGWKATNSFDDFL